jgi:EAL and modified HD-GYP domain-containing signal transduction protein
MIGFPHVLIPLADSDIGVSLRMAIMLTRGSDAGRTDSRNLNACSGDPPGADTPVETVPSAPALDGLRYVARQPITDARGKVHGYELLFRSGSASTAFDGDGDAATRTMLDNTVIFGLEKLTGGLPAFVNCTQEALLDRLVMVLPPSHTVLELLETLEPTAELLTACRELKNHGFRLALDDFTWKPDWKAFVALADYVKVDLSKTSRAERADLLRNLRGISRGTGVQLVAEHVETDADLKLAREEGFTLFQGYHFCKPVLMKNRDIPANRMVHLEILLALRAEPLDISRISSLVKREASLTYRLLRMVNSPAYGLGQVIRSIQGAVVLVGDEMFRRVAMLAIWNELRGNHPSELLQMAFLRGRFCELAAAITGEDPTEQYLLGILSLLPPMLNVPMETIARAMPLRSEVREALLGRSNSARTVLEWLMCYEQGQWECCDQIARTAGLHDESLPQTYAKALLWAETNMSLALDEDSKNQRY